MDLDDELDEDEILIDSEPRYSTGEAQNAHSIDEGRRMSRMEPVVEESKEVDRMDPCPSEHVIQKPQRLLEDEMVHLSNASLKLTDFEVRGTLGMMLRSSCSGIQTNC